MENKASFWQTTQGKSLIKFLAWMFFIIILIIAFSFNKSDNTKPNNEKEQVSVEFKNYEEMQKDIINATYNYTYIITSDTNKTIYTGTKSKEENIGFKETNEGITKYLVKEDIEYKLVLDEKIQITNLFESDDKAFLDLNILFDNLKEYLYSITKNDIKRQINYNKEGYSVIVETDLNNITYIKINNENKTYELQFTNINND